MMPDKEQNDRAYVYCAFCSTGYEGKLSAVLDTCGLRAISATTERLVVRGGVERLVRRSLLPGYVLFEAPEELGDQLLAELKRRPYFLSLLTYQDGGRELRGADLEFIGWLRAHDGVMSVSTVYKEGDRIKVASGPLKDYEGCIVSVNRKRRCVAIQLGGNSVMRRIWCSIEYLENKPETQPVAAQHDKELDTE